MDQTAERIAPTWHSNLTKENHYQSTWLFLPNNRCRSRCPGFKLYMVPIIYLPTVSLHL